MPRALKEKKAKSEAYTPDKEETLVLQHLQKRIPILKDTKKEILDGINFEEIMKDADREYAPHSLREKKEEGGTMLIQDDVRGLRGSRIVKITGKEGEEWRSDVSEPTLLVKVQTALSILIDQNPEAVFKALLKIYKPTTSIAQAIWKRSWAIAGSKEQLKVFVFNLAKYGWAPARTYPRIVQREKEILTELDVDHPENNKYKKVTITEFHDIYREALDPWRTWIDDMSNLTDPWSLDDWYFEKDYSRDTFELEFGRYANANLITFSQKSSEEEEDDGNKETKQRDDITTLGFYESKNKDLYAIWSPKDKVVLYYSPLPNDDGMLSLWDTYWVLRDGRTRYGIGLFEMIKNNKVLYDRLDNMDIDSLVLSIYTMLFYSGGNSLQGDGVQTISPALIKQKLPGTTIDQVKIDYSGKGREGAAQQLERIDEITGLTPTLQGQVEGKTLGEILHAKDAALKRLNIPLSNIAAGIEQDAYLTLSWANQVYSLPEILEFISEEDLADFENESGRKAAKKTVDPKTKKITADFPRILDLGLDEDREGNLVEAPEDRYFVVGEASGEDDENDYLPKEQIRWKGRISAIPQSIIASSQELDRQRKMELYNIVAPVCSQISALLAKKINPDTGEMFSDSSAKQMALDMAKPLIQILEIQNEQPEDWMPDPVIELLNNPEAMAMLKEEAQQEEALMAEQAIPEEEPLFVDPNAPEEVTAPGAEAPPLAGADLVVPQGEVTNPLKDTLDQIDAVRT